VRDVTRLPEVVRRSHPVASHYSRLRREVARLTVV